MLESTRSGAPKSRSIREPPAPDQGSSSVVTRMTLAASPGQVWNQLMFYEQVEARPPLHLRLILPVPIRTVGRKSQVGDEARCLYQGGHLVKRITMVEQGRHYGFEIVEQALEISGGMRLSGGAHSLREIQAGRTEVTLATRYWSPRRPRWLWKRLEALVCHSFHRHILGAMRRNLQGR